MSITNVTPSQILTFTPHLGYFEALSPLQAARAFRENAAGSEQSHKHKNAALHIARDVFKNK